MAETQEAPRKLDALELWSLLDKAEQDWKSADKAKENLSGRNEFVRGVVRSTDQLQATYQGGMGMVNALVGNDAEAARRFSNYQREMRQSTENPATVDKFFSSDPKSGAMASAGNMATWAAGTAGSLIPSVAESVVSGVAGGVAGGMLVPGPDPADVATVPVGALAGMFGKGVVKKAIAEAAEQYIKQGVKREAAEQMATQAVRNVIAKRTGATVAAQQTTALNDGGGVYMEGREKGYDNPASAMALGQISGASEVAFGVFPASLRMVFGKAGVSEVAKKSGLGAAAGYAWDIAKNSAEEGVQEAFQEGLGSINESINDPKAKLFTKENFMKWAESAAAGALGGSMFGVGGAAVSAYQDRGQQPQTAPGQIRDTVSQNAPALPPTQPAEAPTYNGVQEDPIDPTVAQPSLARAEKLKEVISKGYVSEDDGTSFGIPGASRKERLANAKAEIDDLEAKQTPITTVPNESEADAFAAQEVAKRRAAKSGVKPTIDPAAQETAPAQPTASESQQAPPAVQGEVDWNAIATAGTELLPVKAKEKGWSDEELAKTKSEIEGLVGKATQGDVESQNGLIAIAKELEAEKLAKPSPEISDTVSQNEKVPPVESEKRPIRKDQPADFATVPLDGDGNPTKPTDDPNVFIDGAGQEYWGGKAPKDMSLQEYRAYSDKGFNGVDFAVDGKEILNWKNHPQGHFGGELDAIKRHYGVPVEAVPPVDTPKAEQPTPVASPTVPPIKNAGRKESVAPTPPRTMEPTEEGRPTDGKPVMPGDRFLTNTKRETTPYPKYDGSTNRKAIAGEKKSQEWLIDNAIAEAESRGDEYNARIFRNELGNARKGKLPQASKDSATLYVFGDYIPKVPKSILKDVSTPESKNSDTVSQNPKPEPTKGGDPNEVQTKDGRKKQADAEAETNAQGQVGSKGDQATGGASSSESSVGEDYFEPKAVESAKRDASEYKSRSTVINMSPDQFLQMAERLGSEGAADISQEKAKTVSGVLSRGEKFSSIPHLSFEIDSKTGDAKVVGHEGRHRAMELKKRGVKSMPVTFHGPIRWDQQKDQAGFDRIKKWPKSLKGETEGEIPFPISDPLVAKSSPSSESSKELDLELSSIIDRNETQARKGEGGQGLAVGAEYIGYRWNADAIRDFRNRLRKGENPQEASEAVKKTAREGIKQHNARRPKDVNWARWDGAVDSAIESALRIVLRAKEPSPAPVAPEKEQAKSFSRGDVVSAFGKDEAKVVIPDLGDLSWKKGNVRIEMTSGANKGKTMDVEPSDIRPLAEDDTIAGKAAKEASDKAAAKRAEDEKRYNDMRDELLPLVRLIKKSGVKLDPETKKAKKELLDRVMMQTENRNEKMIQDAIDVVAAETEPSEAVVSNTPLPGEQMGLPGMEDVVAEANLRERKLREWRKNPVYEKLLAISEPKERDPFDVRFGDQAFADANMTVFKGIRENIESRVVDSKKLRDWGDIASEARKQVELPGYVDKDSYDEIVSEYISDLLPTLTDAIKEVKNASGTFKIGDAVIDNETGEAGVVEKFAYNQDDEPIAVLESKRGRSQDEVPVEDLRVQQFAMDGSFQVDTRKEWDAEIKRRLRERMGEVDYDNADIKSAEGLEAIDRAIGAGEDLKRDWYDNDEFRYLEELAVEAMPEPTEAEEITEVNTEEQLTEEVFAEPKISPANAETIAALVPTLEKQVGNEISTRRKLAAAIGVIDGEAPQVQRALIDHLRAYDPQVTGYAQDNLESVPIGMRVLFGDATGIIAQLERKGRYEEGGVQHKIVPGSDMIDGKGTWDIERTENGNREVVSRGFATLEDAQRATAERILNPPEDTKPITGVTHVVEYYDDKRNRISKRFSDLKKAHEYARKHNSSVNTQVPPVDGSKKVKTVVKYNKKTDSFEVLELTNKQANAIDNRLEKETSRYEGDDSPANLLRKAVREQARETAPPERETTDVDKRIREAYKGMQDTEQQRGQHQSESRRMVERLTVEIGRKNGIPDGRRHGTLSEASKYKDGISHARNKARNDPGVKEQNRLEEVAQAEHAQWKEKLNQARKEAGEVEKKKILESGEMLEPGTIIISNRDGVRIAGRIEGWNSDKGEYNYMTGIFTPSSGTFHPTTYERVGNISHSAATQNFLTLNDYQAFEAVQQQATDAVEAMRTERSRKAEIAKQKALDESMRKRVTIESPVKTTVARVLESQVYAEYGNQDVISNGKILVLESEAPANLRKRDKDLKEKGKKDAKYGPPQARKVQAKSIVDLADKGSGKLNFVAYVAAASDESVHQVILTDGTNTVAVDADYYNFFSNAGFEFHGNNDAMNKGLRALALKKDGRLAGVVQPLRGEAPSLKSIQKILEDASADQTAEEKNLSESIKKLPETLYQTDDVNPSIQLQALDIALAAEDAGIKTFDQLIAYSVKTVGELRTRKIGEFFRAAAKAVELKGIRPVSDILGVPGVTREQAETVAKAAFGDRLSDEEVSAGIDVVERLGLLDKIGFAPFGSPTPEKDQNQKQGGNVKGWTSFISATRAIIGATNKADVSTFIHEIAHPMRRFLLNREVPQSKRADITDAEILSLENVLGVKDGDWKVEHEERFAKMWERYWFEGKPPKNASPELQSLFEKIAQWMSGLYKAVQQISKPLPKEVRDLFDKLVQRNGDGGFRDTVSQNENRDTVSQNELPETTSIKNEVANELRADRGVLALADVSQQTQDEWLDAADEMLRDDPMVGDRLVKEINTKARNLSNVEVAVMQIHYRGMNNRLEKVSDRLFAAKDANDPAESAKALIDVDIVMNALAEIEEATKEAGREWGRAGVARQIELNKDFSRAAIMRKARIANGGNALSEKQLDDMNALARKVADLEGKLAKAVQEKLDLERRKNVEAQIDDSKGKVQPVPQTLQKKFSDKFNSFKSKFIPAFASSKKTENLFATEDEDMVDEAKSVIQEYVNMAGVPSLGGLLSNIRKELGSDIPVSVQAAFTTAWKDMKDNGDIPVPTVDKNNVLGLSRLAKQIERSLVESGITKLEDVVRGVQESLQEIIPDITERETMDAMSGYGQYSAPSEEKNDQIIADINGRLLEMAKLSDMEAGIAPARTGVGRQEKSPEHRELIRKVNIAKRDGKYRVTDPDTQLKSAVESAKTALVNRIHDLKKAIGPPSIPIASSERKDLAGSDEDVIAYRKERDELMVRYRALFPKPGATMEQRIAATAKALDSVADSLEKQMETRNFETKKKAEPISTEELDAKRARIDALRAQREDIAEFKEWNEERKSKAYKANLLKQIADYKDRAVHSYFGPKPKKEVRTLSPEEVALKLKLQGAKDDFFRLAGLYRLSHMSPEERAWDYVKETAHLSRALMTSLDFSAVVRQGGTVAFAHPKMAAETSKEMYKAMWDEAAKFEFAENIRSDEMYQFAMTAGLSITEDEGKITKQEEAYMGRWARLGIGAPGTKLAAVSKVALSPIAASARGYMTFLNGLRFKLFKHMVANLGKGGQVTLDEAKVIAFYINAATGRSDLGPMMKWAEQANMLFFAPRFVASRFQYLGMPLWLLGSRKVSGRVKKAIAMEYIRHSAGVGSFLALTVALGALLAGDDEEEKPTVSLDPRSSDFLKIKLGETRIDPMSGLSQVIVLMGRIRYGQRVEADGDVVDLRGEKVPYGGLGMAGTIGNFVRTKFAPVPGAAFDIATGENVVGQDVTPFSSIVNLFIPLSLREIQDTAQSRGIPQGALIALMSLHGMGSSTYGPESNYRKGTPEIREKQFKKDIRKMTFDSKEPKYKSLLSEEQMAQVEERREDRKQGLVFSAAANPIRKDFKNDETYAEAVSKRDTAMDSLKKSGFTLDESRKLLIKHWESSYGGAKEMRKGVRVYKEALSDRLKRLRKVFEQ